MRFTVYLMLDAPSVGCVKLAIEVLSKCSKWSMANIVMWGIFIQLVFEAFGI